jgi:hypothetical protein
MSRYRKRPIEVDAIQWNGYNLDEVQEWSEGKVRSAKPWKQNYGVLTVPTLHGDTDAYTTCWIIRGPSGDYWPCAADIFAEFYEPVPVVGGEDKQQ